VGDIRGAARTVRELLKGVKYSIDYYQREYKWQDKQIQELIDDLTDKFSQNYVEGQPRAKVKEYGHYFLGSIILSNRDNRSFVVDGQQRLTTLTLLLIYLRSLQRARKDKVNVDDLIFSEQFGTKSFNIEVEERVPCMEALFEGQPFDPTDKSESVQNIVARYADIEEQFPTELTGEALPYFVDWLIENVHLVEITAYSDEDAYTIFETMNDRGLSLTPTDMLKGFVLAHITEAGKRNNANALWRDRLIDLREYGKEVDSDFFKAWLRSQYATKIRERKAGARPEDFDRMGTEYHRWFRDTDQDIGFIQSDDYFRFIDRDFNFYSRWYLRLMEASWGLVEGLEQVLYNSDHNFTHQYMLLLAPLTPDDPEEVVLQKLRLVALYVDILINWRLWNFRRIAYSTTQYSMFLVLREIRGLDPSSLARKLYDSLDTEEEDFDTNDRLRLHQQNHRYLARMLARITDFVEVQSGLPSQYVDYVYATGKKKFDVEHIWANKPERHKEEFASPRDFEDHRNRVGGLLLLHNSFNRSYGALTYEKKLPHYNSQNMLARSLNPACYEHNPGFLRFVKRSGLPFRPHENFRKEDLDDRGELYRQIAKRIWDPNQLLREVGLLEGDGKGSPSLAQLGQIADADGPGSARACNELTRLAVKAGIDPDQYETWAEVADFLTQAKKA
jgi:hypothetical protein